MKHFRSLLLINLFILFTIQMDAQVKIAKESEMSTPADASSILEVVSGDKGILIPRMTITQRNNIATPATGLMIFQTNNTPGFYYYDGSTWQHITDASNGGDNMGDHAARDHINMDGFMIDGDASNSGEGIFVSPTGTVGINETSPSGRLHISHSNNPNLYLENKGDNSSTRGASINFEHSNAVGAKITAQRPGGENNGMDFYLQTEDPAATLATRMTILRDGRMGFNTGVSGTNAYNFKGLFTGDSGVNDFQQAINVILNPDPSEWIATSHFATGITNNTLATNLLTLTDTVTSLRANIINYGNENGALGHIIKAYGLHIDPKIKSGSIGIMYDLYMHSGGAGGTVTDKHYGIYQAPANTDRINYLGDPLGIGNNDIEASAMLEVESTEKGVLFPRMTTAQRDAISSPANGLVIYNTDEACIQYFDASSSPGIWYCAGANSGSGGSGSSSAFRVHKNGTDQTIAIGFNKITIAAKEFDTNNEFDLSNDRFQPTTAGKYLLVANVSTGRDKIAAVIYKNGVLLKYGANPGGKRTTPNGDHSGSLISVVVDANGTSDYFELYVFSDDTEPVNGHETQTYFSGFAISGPGGGGGATALDELTDVNASSPTADQVLQYNGTEWVAANINSTPAKGIRATGNVQSIPSGTITKFTNYNSPVKDDFGSGISSGNWTVPSGEQGWYSITANQTSGYGNEVNPFNVGVYVYVNGSVQGRQNIPQINPTPASVLPSATTTVYLNAGDVVDARLFHNRSVAANAALTLSLVKITDGSAGSSYATSETNTGQTWVDGKAIYRKAISVTDTYLSTDNSTIAHGITNLDKVVKIYGNADNGTNQYSLPWGNTTGTTSTHFHANSTDIVCRTSATWTGFSDNYVIIEYTKN